MSSTFHHPATDSSKADAGMSNHVDCERQRSPEALPSAELHPYAR